MKMEDRKRATGNRRGVPLVLFSISCFLFPASSAAEAKAAPVDPNVLGLQESFARVAELVGPSVVSITATQDPSSADPYQSYFGDPFEFFRRFDPEGGGPPRPVQGMGSGVIVSPDGYVLTNEHVVHGAKTLKVTLLEPEERTFTGKVVGKDPRTDLAVVKISAKGPLPAVALGDSKKVRVGDWAIAVGSPFGLEQTLTVGVISAVRQSLSIEGREYSDLLQTDAAINRGNSGGPLINIRGEVIGINTAIYAPTGVFAGVGFAIPAHQAKGVMEQLIAKGRVIRGWMGVEIVGMNDVLARQFRVPDAGGVLVNHVLPDSPAQRAGLRRGDVVRSFDGHKIEDQEALIDRVGKTAPGRKVLVSVYRDGAPLDLPLVTEEMPAEDDDAGSPPQGGKPESRLGARWAAATASLADRWGFPADEKGVVVLRVEPGGAADEAGLSEGDLLVSVNKIKTPDLAAFRRALDKLDHKQGLLFDVNRRGRWLYLSYEEAP
jgi:serine protease Do